MPDYKVVNSRSKQIFTDVNLHPGEVLQMELAARGIKKSDFAASLGMKPGHFRELLHGKTCRRSHCTKTSKAIRYTS